MDYITFKSTDAEWLIMKVIWQESPLTASSITKELKQETDWNPKTVQTLIGRLVKKGALCIKKDATLNEYYHLVSKQDCLLAETKTFLQKVYGGSLKTLIANFVNDETLTPKEIKELKSLLYETGL